MRWIRKLASLTGGDRLLLLTAVVWLSATRVGLWLLPLRVVRRLLAASFPSRSGRAAPPLERIVWAVSVAERVVPHATCLTQALVSEAMLLGAGYPADLRIGVDKTGTGRLVAHAWVESDGRVVVGDLRELSRYSPLPPLPSVHA
jgi:hypothetical protein